MTDQPAPDVPDTPAELVLDLSDATLVTDAGVFVVELNLEDGSHAPAVVLGLEGIRQAAGEAEPVPVPIARFVFHPDELAGVLSAAIVALAEHVPQVAAAMVAAAAEALQPDPDPRGGIIPVRFRFPADHRPSDAHGR